MMVLFLLAGASLLFSGLVQKESAKELFEKALYLEETKGDLESAVEVYQRIVEEFPAERKTAAQSLYHIGLCYEKLGLEEAQKAFQKIIDIYPEQTYMVKGARDKVALLISAQDMLGKGEKKFRVRRIWDDAGGSIFTLGTPSPDGRYVSFVDWENFGNLGVRDLVKGKSRLITKIESWDAGEMAFNGVFSPDGSQIAYCWQNKEGIGEVRVIKRDGSQPRILYGNKESGFPWPAAWSLDGKHILTFLRIEGKHTTIAFISSTNGSVRVIKTLGPCPPSPKLRMSLSPDGRYIAYNFIQREESREHDIFLLSADGRHHTPLIEHPADDTVIGWAPEGKGVLFKSDRTGSQGIWFVQVADEKPQGAPQLLRAETGNFEVLGMAQDGSLFYSPRSGWSDIYTATIDPTTWKIKSQPIKIVQEFESFNSAPDCSPDGEYLVCRSSRKGLDAALLIRSFSTGETRELVPKRGISLNFHCLRWSPDGKAILGVGSYKGRYNYLFAIDSQTGDVEIIAEPDEKKGVIHRPDWAPDGKAVFFYRLSKDAYPIYRLDLKTSEEKEIYSPPKGRVYALTLSPDGQQLAFESDNKLMVLAVTGGEPKELTPVKKLSTIAWTRDSKYILYGLTRDKDYTVDLWRIPAEGGEPKKLNLAMPALMHLGTHPDGQRIVFTAQSRPFKAEIWVMENFLPSEEKKK